MKPENNNLNLKTLRTNSFKLMLSYLLILFLSISIKNINSQAIIVQNKSNESTSENTVKHLKCLTINNPSLEECSTANTSEMECCYLISTNSCGVNPTKGFYSYLPEGWNCLGQVKNNTNISNEPDIITVEEKSRAVANNFCGLTKFSKGDIQKMNMTISQAGDECYKLSDDNLRCCWYKIDIANVNDDKNFNEGQVYCEAYDKNLSNFPDRSITGHLLNCSSDFFCNFAIIFNLLITLLFTFLI